MKHLQRCLVVVASLLALDCSDGDSSSSAVTLRSDVTPVTQVTDAQPGVFIPPFLDCRAPRPGDTTTDPSGKVCTHVSIAGATEPGKQYADYASCDVVRTQRPYYPGEPAHPSSATDPRLKDAAFMAELSWARTQIAATGCACCHSAKVAPKGASQWDIDSGPIWLDSISDSGLALFAGLADSSVLGAYPAAENHGFDRTATGVPTTDTARMIAFVSAELIRRGISETQSRAVAPFGGPIYENSVKAPSACVAGEGVDPDGHVMFPGTGRYVYVLEAGSKNPGVPPNLDHPTGTVWRMDVLPSAAALAPGFAYGTTPAGAYQDTPSDGSAPPLVRGRTYHFSMLRDVGLPAANCLFVFGDPLSQPVTQTPPTDGGSSDGFGTACRDDTGCSGVAAYCAKLPGGSDGYCTAQGCKANPSVCPAGWSCFDVSVFQAGAPAFCLKP